MGMIWRYALCAAAAASLASCRGEMPVATMAGFVDRADAASLTVSSIGGDSVVRFVVDDGTLWCADSVVAGNVVEVSYRLPRRDEEPRAIEIAADGTYAAVLGRWTTEEQAELPVDIELLPRGALRQFAPTSLLRFDRWQVDAVRGGAVILAGEAVIAADSVERHPFSVRAVFSSDGVGRMLTVVGEAGPIAVLRKAD